MCAQPGKQGREPSQAGVGEPTHRTLALQQPYEYTHPHTTATCWDAEGGGRQLLEAPRGQQEVMRQDQAWGNAVWELGNIVWQRSNGEEGTSPGAHSGRLPALQGTGRAGVGVWTPQAGGVWGNTKAVQSGGENVPLGAMLVPHRHYTHTHVCMYIPPCECTHTSPSPCANSPSTLCSHQCAHTPSSQYVPPMHTHLLLCPTHTCLHPSLHARLSSCAPLCARLPSPHVRPHQKSPSEHLGLRLSVPRALPALGWGRIAAFMPPQLC